MTEKRNPAGHSHHRVLNIKAVGTALGDQNPTEHNSENQSGTLAARLLVRRFGISLFHARVVCELAGLGRAV